MRNCLTLLLLISSACCLVRARLAFGEFPQLFKFGATTSAFATEGAWDAQGKGPSIWDVFTQRGSHIPGRGDARVAADSYNHVKTDVQLLKSLGVSQYKFSLSWPRILPTGTTQQVNEWGVAYYNHLINELLANGIEPFITLHHWDLPQQLQNLGGWTNVSSVTWFKEYANLCFRTFGDRVKLWTTIEDPVTLAYKGHETGEHAPGLRRPELVYHVGHNLLRAHAEAYITYRDTYKASQNGQVGIVLYSDWYVPKTTSDLDVNAALRAITFHLGWLAEPLFRGEYPSLMKTYISQKFGQTGGQSWAFPNFNRDEVLRVKGTLDFLAISHAKTKLVSHSVNNGMGFFNDQDIQLEVDRSFPKLEYRPEINPDSDKRLMGFGLRDLLLHVTTTYNHPAIYVTANGLETCGTLQDQNRIDYIRDYSNNVLQAIIAGSDVRGYFVNSLLDGFDWDQGYNSKTGLFFVDMETPGRPRYPRSSATFYRSLIARNGFDSNIVSYRVVHPDRDEFYHGSFPAGFLWGTATSDYQTEGAWRDDGKGVSIWDTFAHSLRIDGNQTGDVACDSYHLYPQDVQLLQNLGVNFYRFSIAWTRILPDGTTAHINQAGIDHYNNLIDTLVAKGITPIVTLYSWDLPQALQDQGGWTNENTVNDFAEYARICFHAFGDRVKRWVTFNEPYVFSVFGYDVGFHPPGRTNPGLAVYQVGHNVILAHAKAYHIYKDEYKNTQNGIVGINLYAEWMAPLTDSASDVAAAERAMEFSLGWFANPIFSGSGDYPQVMKAFIGEKSRLQGFATSRLPEFTDVEKQFINGSADFLGINHYTTRLVSHRPNSEHSPTQALDQDLVTTHDCCWPDTHTYWLRVNPWGIRAALSWAKTRYQNPAIVISENGRSTSPGLNDQDRIYYHKYYINEVLKAIKLDAVNVQAYTAWSLLDNLEWSAGYRPKFGLYQVDFNSPYKTRVPKASVAWYSDLIRRNGFFQPVASSLQGLNLTPRI